jgi:hypothetical protein
LRVPDGYHQPRGAGTVELIAVDVLALEGAFVAVYVLRGAAEGRHLEGRRWFPGRRDRAGACWRCGTGRRGADSGLIARPLQSQVVANPLSYQQKLFLVGIRSPRAVDLVISVSKTWPNDRFVMTLLAAG